MRILFPPTLCLLVLFTVGCGSMVKSHYQKPRVNFPAHWQQEDTGIPPAPFDWRDFHDPVLDKWLQQVIISNNDLAVAVLRVYRARLEADRTGISTAPGISATLNIGAGTALDKVSPVTRNSSASVSTNYEADLGVNWHASVTRLNGPVRRQNRICSPPDWHYWQTPVATTGALALSVSNSLYFIRVQIMPWRHCDWLMSAIARGAYHHLMS